MTKKDVPEGARPAGRAPLPPLVLAGLEGFLAAAGILCLLRAAIVRAEPAVTEATVGREFDREVAAARIDTSALDGEPESEPDCGDWSAARIRGFEELRKEPWGSPLARLEIPTIGLRALVFDGTDHRTLDRGIGHVAGTPRPGEKGNIALAAHRDGFFRGLEKMGPGDELRLVTPHGCATYRTTKIDIVTPDDVSCLAPSDDSRVTLVTCYPFRFVGPAPLRFVLRAEKVDAAGKVAGAAYDARTVAPEPAPQRSRERIATIRSAARPSP